MPKRLLQGCMFRLFFMLIKSNGAPTGFLEKIPATIQYQATICFMAKRFCCWKEKNETKQIDDIEFVFSPLRMYVWVCVCVCVRVRACIPDTYKIFTYRFGCYLHNNNNSNSNNNISRNNTPRFATNNKFSDLARQVTFLVVVIFIIFLLLLLLLLRRLSLIIVLMTRMWLGVGVCLYFFVGWEV